MAVINTSSGLDGFFSNLQGMLDQKAKDNDTLRGLAAGGIIPQSAAPQSILGQLQSIFGSSQAPALPAASLASAPAQPAPQQPAPMAFAPPSAAVAPASSASPAPRAVAPAPAASPAAPAFAPAPSGPLPTFAAAGGAPGQDNTSRALAFYQSKGLSPLAASALVGGFHAESGKGLNTTATNAGDGSDGSNSIGIAQWNGDRARGLQQFAASNGLDPSNIDTQLQYSWLELNGPEKATLNALSNPNLNPAQATAAALGYERPAGWSAQNPYGAKTFGSRLKNTVGLASTGFNTPFDGSAIGPNPNGFTPSPGQGGALPSIAASGQGMALSPATPFAASRPAPAAAFPASSFAAPSAAVPAQRAIAQAAPDASDDDDDKPEAVQVPARAPGTAVAASPAAPSLQAPSLAAAPTQTGFAQQPTLPQIQALIVNPETRDLGLKLWQATLQKNDPFTLSAGQARYDGSGHVIATAPEQDYTLSQGQQRFHGGQQIAAVAAKDDTKDDSFNVQVVGEDQYGNKQYGAVNKRTGAITPVGGQPGAQGAANPLGNPGVADLHGQDFLSTLDQNTAAQVKAIVEGRAPYPTGMLLKTPYGQQLAAYVTQADPTFEAGNAGARVKVRNEFLSGGPSSPAGMITAGNTAIQHLGHLSDAAEALNNGQFPLKNWVGNEAAQQTGGGTAVNQFNNILGKYVEEATKFYRGTGGTEADIQRDLGNLNSNMSPAQLHTAIQTQVDLLQGKINALQDRWRQGMGPMVGDFQIVQPDSQGALSRIAQRAGIAPTNAPQPAGQVPQPGAGLGAQNAKPPVRVSTPAEAMALPSGTPFVTPDGRIKVRP